ncbi:unnamed protein product [Caenorhabditis sp. 36 PRJEB53466]|nr:unnamed protein product [Caenorhabditis sp. 36 PRJEB53466]
MGFKRLSGLFSIAVDEVFEKAAGHRNAFVVVRPPGHHASASQSSGFCILNNAALAAKRAQKEHNAKRVLILDWDVHHGNGTQEIFYDDESVMYMSIHRHDKGTFYPIGEPKDYSDVGEDAGEGTSVNVPFSGATMGDAEYQIAFQRIILPVAYQFNPDFVIISAGFDAATDDPLGDYKVTPETYALMTYQLSALASGRVLTVLEGGYNLTSISNSAVAVCEVLKTRGMLRRLTAEKEQFASLQKKIVASCIKTIREVCAEQQKYWSILKGFQVVPADHGLNEMVSDQKPTSSDATSDTDSFPAYSVVPLMTCPHLEQVTELPKQGIDSKTECSSCRQKAEVWTCLTCWKYNCGRFVNQDAVKHFEETSHPMALSMADLSVWCYPCESYVHNPVLIPAKSSAHESKFGEQMPK